MLNGGGGGGLTKLGSGTLRLNGASTYTGPTLVSTGTLGGTGSLLSPVTIASGATLSPGAGGIGNLTVNTNVTLSLGSTNLMEINKTTGTNDLLTGVTTLNYGGTLNLSLLAGSYAPGDSFKLFNAATYNGSFSAITPAIPAPGMAWNTSQLGVSGTLSIVATVNVNPTNIVASVSGGNLNVSWPSDHTGWRLQIQTNALSVGLTPATNAWSTVAGSASTNAVAIPINPANPAVFLRMVYP